MSDELKPCPFCGKLPEWSDYYHCYRCANLDCMCDCHSYVPSSKENQLEQWNTRPIEDAIRAELAAKNAEIERLKALLKPIGYHDVEQFYKDDEEAPDETP